MRFLYRLLPDRQRSFLKSLLLSFPDRLRALDFRNISIRSNGKYLFEFRRAIHRLEKSLTFKVRREGGGINITNEILNLLELNKKYNFADDFSLTWAYAVLDQERDCLQSDKSNNPNSNNKITYTISLLDAVLDGLTINQKFKLNKIETGNYQFLYDELYSFMKSRKSIRSFKYDPISTDQIIKAIDIARLTPTPCNKQAGKISIIQDKKIIDKVLALQGGLVGYNEYVNNIAVISSTREAYPGFNEKQTVYVEGALLGMNFIWGLHIQNISTVVLNWTGNYSKTNKLNSILNLNKYYVPVYLIAFGYADNDTIVPLSPRQSSNDYLNMVK